LYCALLTPHVSAPFGGHLANHLKMAAKRGRNMWYEKRTIKCSTKNTLLRREVIPIFKVLTVECRQIFRRNIYCLLYAGFLLGLLFNADDWATFSSEMLTFIVLHGVTSHKIEIFITDAMRTSNIKSSLLSSYNSRLSGYLLPGPSWKTLF
jgi:hypothetical protein